LKFWAGVGWMGERLLYRMSSKIQRRDVFMSDKRYDRIEAGIRESYPNSCILFIEEIIHAELEARWSALRDKISQTRGRECQVLELYHGTREEFANSIIKNGFEPAANKVSAYGRGTYFAKAAAYSKDYAPPAADEVSFMLVCDVLVGECGLYGANKVIDTAVHDNSVNNLNAPTIYVSPYAAGAIPRFLVAFHRNAR
jgi:hypothetical protein